MISTLLDDTSLSSPFTRPVFVMWHAFYHPLLYALLLCGPCNRWALRCQSDSFHAAAVPQRATCVIRVEQRGPLRIDFIDCFFIFHRRTVVSISRCVGSMLNSNLKLSMMEATSLQIPCKIYDPVMGKILTLTYTVVTFTLHSGWVQDLQVVVCTSCPIFRRGAG